MIPTWRLFLLTLVVLTSARAAPPLKGGRFVVGLPDYPKHLLHYIAADEYSSAVNSLVLEPLVSLSPKTNLPEARLAKVWSVSPEGKLFSFELDERAKFHDGKPVTAKDVEFTWRLVQESPHTAGIRAVFDSFSDCRATAPLRVTCTAKRVHFKNLEKFAELNILPEHVYAGQDLKAAAHSRLVGSGPYRLAEARAGERIILKREPAFWGAAIPANRDRFNFDEIVFRAVTDAQTQFELFKRGEIDYYFFMISKMWFTETDGLPFKNGYIQKLKLENEIPQAPMSIAWNTRRPLFSDRRVRRALTHLMNREKWIQDLFYGAYVTATGPIATKSEFHSPKNTPLAFDPKKARALLAEAGWKANDEGTLVREGRSFEFELLSDSPALNRFLTLYQEDLKHMGIRMNIRTVDWSTALSLVEERRFDAFPISRSRDADPGDFAAEWGSKEADVKGSRNVSGYRNPKLDALAERIDSTLDKQKRRALVRRLDEILGEDQPVSYAWEPVYFRIGYWNRVSFPDKGYYPFSRWRDAFHHWWWDPAKEERLQRAKREGTPLS